MGTIIPPLWAHVVPEDELRNKVYLTKTQVLKEVFSGAKKIRHVKKRLSETQVKSAQETLGQNLRNNRVDFYKGKLVDGRHLHAFIDKAETNSHPPTKAVFLLLIDSTATVVDIRIMEYKGPQRSEIISPTFLNQFKGKSSKSDFSSITSNQGTTQPVQALAQKVRHLAALFSTLAP